MAKTLASYTQTSKVKLPFRRRLGMSPDQCPTRDSWHSSVAGYPARASTRTAPRSLWLRLAVLLAFVGRHCTGTTIGATGAWDWVETPFSKKQSESSASCMAVRYAHNRVETAADSRFRLLAGLYEVQRQSKAVLTWDNLRCERFLWEKLL